MCQIECLLVYDHASSFARENEVIELPYYNLERSAAFKMGKAGDLTVQEKNIIARLRKGGNSLAGIAKIVGRSKTAVFQALKPGKVQRRPGRPRTSTSRFDRLLIQKVKANPFLSSSQLRAATSAPISTRTIRRRLQDVNLNSRTPRKVPLLSKKNIKLREEFARRHLYEVSADNRHKQWENILWTGESKVNLFGSDAPSRVRRPPNTEFESRHTVKTVKHGGGNIKIWGCFSYIGVGPLFWIKETMTKDIYRNILSDVMLPYARQNMAENWIFQQDNDPKHTAKVVRKWFEDNQVTVLEWPAQSPDLNPIEHLWNDLKKRLPKHKITNEDQLRRKI